MALVEGYRFAELHADIGDRVAPGDVLASLATGTLDAQLQQATAQAAGAEAAVKQAQSQITRGRIRWVDSSHCALGIGACSTQSELTPHHLRAQARCPVFSSG